MRWTDEVHVNRTLAARREARQLSKGQPISSKGRAAIQIFGLALGSLAVLSACENQGRFRVRRLPYVGSWLSSKLRDLRRTVFVKRNLSTGKRPQAGDAARDAALRRQAASTTHQTQAPSSQSQQADHRRPNKKNKKGKKR